MVDQLHNRKPIACAFEICVQILSNLSGRWIHQIKRVWDHDKSQQVQWGCSCLGLKHDLEQIGYEEVEHELQWFEGCSIF